MLLLLLLILFLILIFLLLLLFFLLLSRLRVSYEDGLTGRGLPRSCSSNRW